MTRLRADIWVSAFLRRHNQLGRICVVSRRGDPQAGAIWIEVDHLDGTVSLFGPAPMMSAELSGERIFRTQFARQSASQVQARMVSEEGFDPDFWLVTLEEPAGEHGLELAPETTGQKPGKSF
ncbi:MAG: DUF1491 family protein [Alphaproteobacteria bacterium]|nr:DUF1491 family protein [Alphaproteobacteria bacterium]